MSNKNEIVITGENKDVLATERTIDYGDRQTQYHLLSPKYRKLVDETVTKLTEGIEHVGYNFRQVQDWYKQSGVNRYLIAEQLAGSKLYEIFDDEYAAELDEDIEDGSEAITKLLSRFQSTVTPKSGTPTEKMLDYLCDYYLISKDLLYKGCGEIYEPAEAYFDDFIKSVNDLPIFADEFTTLEAIKVYAAKKNLKLEDVLVTRYAVIAYSGSYQILNSKKYAPQKAAVDNLMDTLMEFMNH